MGDGVTGVIVSTDQPEAIALMADVAGLEPAAETAGVAR